MRFTIRTYGCQMNVRDSEAVEALMLEKGYEKAESEEDADIVIINSCTVRQKAEEKAIGKAGNMIAAGKQVWMIGCAVKRLGADLYRRLPKVSFAATPEELAAKPEFASAHVVNGFQAFVTVMTGCNNRCSYCIVPAVRGPEKSRPEADIFAEVEFLAGKGVREVTLLGQSVLRYNGFPRLLRRIAGIDGIERIRFTSAHPSGCTDELVEVYRDCPKVCRHLHLPVQSGSDRVLAEMGRRYTRAEYLAAVAKLRAFDPEFSVTTDVIVGYPGETEEDFEATRSLMEEAQFDNAFVFKYSPRPGTRSALLADDVSTEEKERRDQVLLADQERRGQKRNDALAGSVREVLVEGPSKRNPDRWSGRDSGNRIVVWDADDPASRRTPGEFARIKILEAHPQILVGEIERRGP